MEQLLNPIGGMPENLWKEGGFDSYEGLEAVGDYICVDITMKCEQAH
jgi:hypothetical protein